MIQKHYRLKTYVHFKLQSSVTEIIKKQKQINLFPNTKKKEKLQVLLLLSGKDLKDE